VRPRLLLLGGLDPSGGAGVTADATVAALHGTEALPVPVVLTAQNRRGFRATFPVAPWHELLEAALGDGPVHAVKTGLLGNPATIAEVGDRLRLLAPAVPLVVDPVLSASAGGYTAGAEVAAAYREHLLPLATLLTPNGPELLALGGDARALLATGCRAVLHKGGHGDGGFAEDVLVQPDGTTTLRRPRLCPGPVHGTGCALATAIAAHLANNVALAHACRAAGDWLAALLAALGPAPGDGLPRPLPFAAVLPLMRTSTR